MMGDIGMEKAIEKLQKEMKTSKEPYVQLIGQYLIDHVRENQADAVHVLDEKKSIAGSLEHMKNMAKKKQKNGYAIFTPDEGFAIILEYYGIETRKTVIENHKTVLETTKSVHKLDINLEELL